MTGRRAKEVTGHGAAPSNAEAATAQTAYLALGRPRCAVAVLAAVLAILTAGGLFSPGGRAAAAPTAASPADGRLAIDFNNVDIRVFIKYISQLTGKNFVVDKDVKGAITVISATPVSAGDAYRVFESVLDVHGYAAVEAGEVVKIVPKAGAKNRSIAVRTKLAGPAGDRMVTQLVRLEHSDPEMVRKLLAPLVPKNAVLTAYRPAGLLIITDTAANVERLVQIVRQVDVPGTDRRLSILELKNAGAAAVARTLQRVFASGAPTRGKQAGGGQARAAQVSIVPYEQTNMIIVLASKADTQAIRDLVAKLDAPPPTDQGNIHVYYLQYANAEELAQVLTRLPGKGQGKTPGKVQTFARDVRIVADKATNALVITADPSDYQMLEGVIRDLDIPRRMVYIEALIMEVNVERNFSLGVEWLGAGKTDIGKRDGGVFGGFSGTQNTATGTAYDLLGGLARITDSAGAVVKQSLLPPGFAMGVYSQGITVSDGNTTVVFPSLGALLHAYRNDADVHILSTPQILTTDNEEARIQVGENVPYLTKEAKGDQNYETYEYRDVGVTLKITPQINQDGLVRLKIFQEVIKLKGNVDTFRPATLKRVAETTVIVKDGNTVVIGGIIGDDSTSSEFKVPLLGDLPVLGRLFSYSTRLGNRTNLFVFITPRVIGDPSRAGAKAGPTTSSASGTPLSVAARLVALGYDNLERGDYTTAESYYRKALLLEPDNPYALLNLGVIAQRTGRPLEAADLYRRVIALQAAAPAVVSTDPGQVGRSVSDIARANLKELLDSNEPAAGEANGNGDER